LSRGEWLGRFGMKHLPAWAYGTLVIVLVATMRLFGVREPVAALLAVVGSLCAWRVVRLEQAERAAPQACA
jgi:uncharacterized membrane protein (UPF0136 family)